MQDVGHTIASKSGFKKPPSTLSPECSYPQTTGPTKALSGQGASSPLDPFDPSPPISPTLTVAGHQGDRGGALPPPSDPDSGSSPSGEEGALLKETNRIAEKKEQARQLRQALRSTSRNVSPNKRHQTCGHASIGDVILNELGERVYATGLRSCGSVWECPVCSGRIAMQRIKETEEVLNAHLDAGGGAMFQTLTMPHDWTDKLKALQKAVAGGWTYVTNHARWNSQAKIKGPAWKLKLKAKEKLGIENAVRAMPHDWTDKLKALQRAVAGEWAYVTNHAYWDSKRKSKGVKWRMGIENVIRAMEGTHGANGYHIHLHNLILTERPLTEEEGEELRASIYEQWATYIEEAGYRLPDPKRCQMDHVSRRDVGRYLSKFGAALELVGGRGKGARSGNRTPWEVLADYREHGRPEDLSIWKEWATGMKGAKQLTGLSKARKRLGLAEGKTDDEAAAEDEGQLDQGEQEQEPRQVARVNPKAWGVVQRTDGAERRLLEVAARRGYEGVREYLDDLCRWPPGEDTARPPIIWEDENDNLHN